jgi:hypothetical protein
MTFGAFQLDGQIAEVADGRPGQRHRAICGRTKSHSVTVVAVSGQLLVAASGQNQ